jgi:two-component system chemotaxis sensor kinase CheA
MEEIIDDFVTEAEESLEKIDPLFVELEERGYDRELLNDIFRSMHTIKGAAGFLGFQGIVDVAHKAESLMKRLRDGEMQVSSEIITVILRSTDTIKLLLGHIKAKDGVEEDVSAILADLDAALESEAAAPAAPPTPAAPPAPEAGEPAARPRGRQDEADDLFRAALEAADAQARAEAAPEARHAPKPATPAQPKGDAVAEAAARAAEQAAANVTAADQAQAQQTQSMKAALQTLRVDVDRIDKVMNLTGEIVLVRNRLLNIANNLDQKYQGDEHVDGLQEAVSFLDLVTSDIQLAVMKMRMQPIKKVFGKFPRLVRDISQNLGKDVHLTISGEDTEVDRSVIERIGDPLVHIIRNAIDHGIEGVEERTRSGKQAKGHVQIAAFQQGSQIVIEVNDDGRGIDVARIKAKGVAKGLISEEDAARMTDKEAINLVFLPGFSTVDNVTELSGRGVGMDVVKTNISRLNGYVEIVTMRGKGSTIRISIPLTLAIIQALMVRVAGHQFAIPLGPIEETLKIMVKDVANVTGRPVLAIRDHVYPLSELTDILNLPDPEMGRKVSRYVLVIAVGDREFCVSVDELLGQEEVVIKAIEGIDTDMTGILGATITGEGKIVLILDPASMSRVVNGLATV